ncbi:MAG: aldehyde dehydrogenase family protein [Steroidobacter sp.]
MENPASGRVLGAVSKAGLDQAVAAVERAQSVFNHWRRTTARVRSAVLRGGWSRSSGIAAISRCSSRSSKESLRAVHARAMDR